ncbi:MAG: flagellar biosynthesis protein FlhB [Pseudomonadota bacterium]
MAEQEQNRSEAATPYKIAEAKKRGSVSKSVELNSLLAIVAFLIVLAVSGWHMAGRQLHINQRLLSQAHQVNFESSHFMTWLNGALLDTLHVLAPLFGVLVVIAILSNVLQTGPIFTLFPLKPDVDRINPVSGFKRLLTLRLVIEAIKSVIKLVLFGTVLYFAIRNLLPALMQLMHISPVAYSQLVLSQMATVIAKLACVIALIALLDFLYSRWEYGNKLKMSRREVKDEVKRRDGDPRVRARIRELQRETLKRSQALSRVKEADVVIANPVHLAVAIKYVRGEMQAPAVLAKGAGELAALMKGIARKHGIPVVENKVLARALFRQVDFDGPVPEKLYPDVARLLVWVYALRAQNQREAAA